MSDPTDASTTTMDMESTTETTGGEQGVVESCGLPEPCDGFTWQCDPSQPIDCVETPFDEALTCQLQGLVAGEPARFHVRFNGYLSGEVDWLDIGIRDDGVAVRQYAMESPRDLETYWDPPEECTLRPTEFFEACLADDGGMDMHAACMDPYQWFEGDCTQPATCP